MRVPLAWLREYVELPDDPKKVAHMLAQLGFPVASVDVRPVITGVIAGKIAELDKHPNADRLLVGRIDIGDGAPLTIATAATNVARGQTIAVATVGARLPQLTIERKKMRGVESEGMMISADELALPAEWFEDGIMQFDEQLVPGTDVVEYFRLSEAVLDVEVTSNRVDAMSVIGLARELAAYQGQPLRLPDFTNPGDAARPGPKPRVTIESPDCRRFVAQLFSNASAGISPAWMRIRLALAGQRPINQLVDVSNYVMLETAQPLHFYDAAKIPHHHLIVRDARPGERLITLDGNERELTPEALVIASETGAEGLAGLMGGRSSEVTGSTRELLLESANFNGARIRRTALKLGFRTDASSRHEKALAPALTDIGAARAAQFLTQFGASASQPVAFGEPQAPPTTIAFETRDVKRLLGFELSGAEIRDYLDRLGFETQPKGKDTLAITPPPWRTDVALSADVVEELARIAGYDRIAAEIPSTRDHEIASTDYRREREIGSALARLGYREVVTYSLHGANLLEKAQRANVEPLHPVEVLNPLSEEQRYLRSALSPGLLDYLARVDVPMRVFEVGHVFYSEDRQPLEFTAAMFAFSAEPLDEPEWRDSHFLRIKGDAEAFVRTLTGCTVFETAADERPWLHPGKTGVLLLDGREVAMTGLVHPRVQQAFGLRLPVYLCRLNLRNIPEYELPQFKPPSKYPSTYRDVALVCDLAVPAQRLEAALRRALGALSTSVRTFDEYRGPQVAPGKKSLAIRMTLQKTDATITDPEADAAVERALAALRQEFDVSLRQ